MSDIDGPGMSRRVFGAKLAAGAIAAVGGDVPPAIARDSASPTPVTAPFELDELSLRELQDGMATGRYSARALVELYLDRIARLDRVGPALAAVIELNPDALTIADALDIERKTGRSRGPLHGIPILIKDNIATADRMQTTAGSLALVGCTVPRDAAIVERLRAAGAVILGKVNLSEWANFRSTHSSGGWSARGGQTKNPYALDRNPQGSSSGTCVAVAANFCAVGIGTETDGSITAPASCCAVVGIKPTVGLLSRSGIIPVAHSQDTAGPVGRSVEDAAILLGVLAGEDPLDPATAAARGRMQSSYTQYLDRNGLKGARIGLPRERLFGYSPAADNLAEDAIAALRDQGAIVVDPANIATAGKFDDSEMEVLLYEFKADLNVYLMGLTNSSVRSLSDVIAYNIAHASEEMPFFGQELFEQAQQKGPLTDAAYRNALARNRKLSRTKGIDAVMDKFRLDALVAPTLGPATLIDLVNGDPVISAGATTPAAVAGYPHVTVPMGFAKGLPVGLSFFGRAWSEPTLIRLAYAYEQATKLRRLPGFLPSLRL